MTPNIPPLPCAPPHQPTHPDPATLYQDLADISKSSEAALVIKVSPPELAVTRIEFWMKIEQPSPLLRSMLGLLLLFGIPPLAVARHAPDAVSVQCDGGETSRPPPIPRCRGGGDGDGYRRAAPRKQCGPGTMLRL